MSIYLHFSTRTFLGCEFVSIYVDSDAMCSQQIVCCYVWIFASIRRDSGSEDSDAVPEPAYHVWLVEGYPKFHLKCRCRQFKRTREDVR